MLYTGSLGKALCVFWVSLGYTDGSSDLIQIGYSLAGQASVDSYSQRPSKFELMSQFVCYHKHMNQLGDILTRRITLYTKIYVVINLRHFCLLR